MMEVEERPVADRLDGIATPAESKQLVGHNAAAERIIRGFSAGKLHHAWLLSGPQGIGKATFAFHLAKHILSFGNPSGSPGSYDFEAVSFPVHRQIAQGAHPDLLHLTRPWDSHTKRFKTQLSVDEIRRTQSFYSMTAGAGGWRITIVDSADDMNVNAANALLKILEEPPKRSLFFVLAHSPGALLPTIRSRCQSLPLQPLEEADLTNIVRSLGVEVSDGQLSRAVSLAEGSVRQVLQLLDGDVAGHFAKFQKVMQEGGQGSAADWLIAHDVSDALARRGNEHVFNQFADLVVGWIAAQVRNRDDTALAELAGWVEVWDKANRSVALADSFNLDRKQAALNLFSAVFRRDIPR